MHPPQPLALRPPPVPVPPSPVWAAQAASEPGPSPSLIGAAAQSGMCGVMDSVKRFQGELLRPYGFHSRSLETSVGRVRILEAGDCSKGPTWVYFHGFASEAVDYGPLLKRMQRHCGRMVVVDLPGHGMSPCPPGGVGPDTLVQASEDILRICTNSNERVVLVGNSMGGLGAVRMAHKFRNRVDGLVLMSPAGAPTSPQEMDELMERFNLTSYQSALAFIDKLFINGNRLREIYAAGVWAHMNRPHLQALLHTYRTYPPVSAAELQDLPPTLLIWGDGDNFLPRSNRDFFVKNLPADRTTLVTEASFSHSPYLDRAGEVADVMLTWGRQQVGLVTE